MTGHSSCRRGRPAAIVAALALALAPAAGSSGAPPRRVVSLAPSLTETVFALGAGDRLVGVTEQCDFPPAAADLPKTGTFLEPNVEAVLALQPDVVLAVPGPANRDEVNLLRSLGVRVEVFDEKGVKGVFATIHRAGEVLGVPDRAASLEQRLRHGMRRVTRRLEGAAPRPVLFLVNREPPIAAGAGTYQDDLIRLAGGTNVAAAAGRGWPRLSLEAILAFDPEVILDGSMNGGDQPGRFWSRFPNLRAVRSGRVHGPVPDALLRPGPRLVEALEALARFLHPERFPDIPAPEASR